MKLFGRKIKIGKGLKNFTKGVGKFVRKNALPVALGVATGGTSVLAGVGKSLIGGKVLDLGKNLLSKAPNVKLGRIPEIVNNAKNFLGNFNAGNKITVPITKTGDPTSHIRGETMVSQRQSGTKNINIIDRLIQWISDLFN